MREMKYYKDYSSPNGGYLWPIDDWINYQRHLVTVDALMRLMAQRFNLDFLGDIIGHGFDWPARRLRFKRISRYWEISISLNSQAKKNGHVLYDLRFSIFKHYFGYFLRPIKNELVKQYHADQLNDTDILINDLEALIKSFMA